MTKIGETPGPTPPRKPGDDQATRSAKTSFANRLEGSQAQSTASNRERLAEANQQLIGQEHTGEARRAVVRTELSQEQAVVQRQESRSFAMQQSSDDPFRKPDEAELQGLLTEMNQSDPGSIPMKMLRLQYAIQQESLHFQFESNKAKSDHDDVKNILNNIR